MQKVKNIYAQPAKLGWGVLGTFVCGWILLPVLAGVIQSLVGAFGYLPGVVLKISGLDSWAYWLVEFSNLKAFLYSFLVAISSTLLALFLSFTFLAFFYDKISRSKLFKLLIFIFISTPHIALVTGIINVYSMAGFLDRLLCFFVSCEQPLFGIVGAYPLTSIILVFVLKEAPFIIYISFASLKSIPLAKLKALGFSLGYSAYQIYWKIILPQLYSRIKLPLWVVLSYSFSSVDVPLVLSDLDSQLASVIILDKFYSPAFLNDYALGFAGSILLILGCLFCFFVWRLLEKILFRFLRYLILVGNRQQPIYSILLQGQFLVYLFLGWILPYAMILLWSFSNGWYFPSLLPDILSLKNYYQAALQNYNVWLLTVVLGLSASVLGLLFALLANEILVNLPFRTSTKRWFIYLALSPIILPQISFLFGFQILLEYIMVAGSFFSLLWAHSLFCFSYAYSILQYKQQTLNMKYMYVGYALGLSKMRAFFKIKLHLMLPAIKSALGVGFSVSVALYLPTLFAGGGRYATLMTESISFINSFNPRLSSTYAVLLTVLPLLFFIIFYFPQTKNEQ